MGNLATFHYINIIKKQYPNANHAKLYQIIKTFRQVQAKTIPQKFIEGVHESTNFKTSLEPL